MKIRGGLHARGVFFVKERGMRRLGTRNLKSHLAVGAVVAIAGAAAAPGCGGGGGETTMGTGGHASSSSSTGSGGHVACTTPLKGPTRGSAIAISSDDALLVVANRESGSVTVMSVAFDSGGQPTLTKTAEVAVGAGTEPWQVAIDGCDDTAYVVLRKDQKVVEITDLKTKPAKGREISVGSEPTSLALTPYNSKLYVANSVEGTLSVIDPLTMKLTDTVDLNAALVADPKYLGTVKARPSLAHPRSIAITNSGGADDEAEKVYVTEFFAQQIAVEASDATNADVFKAGLVYSVKVADGSASVIELGPIADTGFDDTNKTKTGCYPNQLQSIALDGKFAYVTSICASPRGPLGVLNGTKVPPPPACTVANQDTVCGSGGQCDTTTLLCKPNLTNVKTTTHPAVSVFDTSTDTEVKAGTTNLDKNFKALYGPPGGTGACPADDGTCRLPHIANEMAFLPSTGVAYVSANGADAVFRVHFDPAAGTVTAVGSEGNKPNFINLSPAAISDPKLKGQNPIGIVVGNSHGVAFTVNDVTRNVTAIDLGQQSVADTTDPDPTKNHSRVAASSALPTDPAELARLRGKHFFNTGLGRWSLKGQGWGSCQACHQDGLSDNVTWYFNRGPRQSVSLDGSFSKTDPTDRRIFNWTAIFDEVSDFENNTRGVSGGVGALVSHDPSKDTPPTPPAAADRIAIDDAVALPPAGAVGLNGSTIEVTGTSVIKDWDDITTYIKSIRSPRAPNSLDAAQVSAGETLFKTGGFCQGCHGGSKWTISKVFYTPSGVTNEGLKAKTWDPTTFAGTGPGKFPTALLPATTATAQVMRFGGANPAALDQLLCILRPVGTFNTAETGVGIAELRQDGKPAQGNAVDGNGYNPPSLLGLQVAAPFFHAGNARTLEAMFSTTFGTHWKALAATNFLVNPADIDKLVAYLLSIDGSTKVIAPPAAPNDQGGNFCAP
jgi:YVTN family beta-propeller protein